MRKMLLLPLAGLVLLLSGCGTTKIGRILDEPTRFRNRNVTVEGRVDRSFGAVVTGVYQVEDNTGKIYVLSSRGGVPRRGTSVRVTGRVQQGITIGNRAIGTVITEDHHKIKY